LNYEKCTSVVKNSRVVVQENRSSFELVNEPRHRIERVEVDGCLITGDQERCDWLLVVKCNPEVAYYVELKGCDLKKAVSQLGATLKATKDRFALINRKCYAVTTRVPRQGPTVQKLARAFYKEHSVLLEVKNIRASVNVAC
jgi:hypothetical protein